jgi:septum formation protein
MTQSCSKKPLWLASTSPRRGILLNSLGIPFETIAPQFEETPTDLSVEKETLFFAEQKARSVAALCPDSLVIGSDTIVECDGEKLGKPADKRDARRMLKKLSRKTHRVITAVVLLDTSDGSFKKVVEEAFVTFRGVSDAEIDDYIATGEPMDKAGAYAAQGEAKKFINQIDGEVETVVGLPLKKLREWLEL